MTTNLTVFKLIRGPPMRWAFEYRANGHRRRYA